VKPSSERPRAKPPRTRRISARNVRDGEEGERVEVRQGSVPDPDLVVTGDAETFLAVASGRLSPEEAVQSGALRVEGDREEDREALLACCQSLVGPAAA
jgi:predicted lipid carrier protein YhbT